ncbi:hypothetical protein LI328DRAFT_37563 [Trichoderma asperelloides]|nr:hypothetical protein LI328DRAFT_37563 [Trichoderma asperelloides]
MGNTTSAEAPRKAPQKLSKPRAASHGAMPRPRNPTGAAASSSTRMSESYLAASLPFSSRDSQNIAGGGNEASEPYVERLYEPSRRLSRRESDYMRSPVLPESPITNTRSHSLYANSVASNQMRRASSVMHSDPEQRLSRTQSWHGNRMDRGRSMQSELLQFYESQQLPRTSSEFLQELQAAAMKSQSDAHQNRRASSIAGASLVRTTSDLSFYAPMRRRSVIQTPGVATRPRRDDLLSIPDRTSSRKSQPVFGDDSYTFKPSSKAPKHISMPPMPIGFAPLERAVTPQESDYKQLGGMKFGSLKIMNGSPPSSPQDIIKRQQQKERASGPGPESSSAIFSDDSGIELKMARRKQRHSVIGSVAESRALASISGFNLNGKSPQSSNKTADPLGDLMPSPLSKVPSTLQNLDSEENDGTSGKATVVVRRSNSGFASTTSSESSHRPSLKTDSGYSSNASERSFLSSNNADDKGYTRPLQTRRRTLEQPAVAPILTADGIKKQSRLYRPFVRVERSNTTTNDSARGSAESPSALVRPRAKRNDKHYHLASSSGLPSHRLDASSATLNTIMSVDNLVPSDSAALSSHGFLEVDAGMDGAKSLKKRRSLRKVAEAATSRMSSLNLNRRKSAAGNMTPSATEKRKRASSLVNGNVSAAASGKSMPAAATSQSPKVSNRDVWNSGVKGRASAPELRVAIPTPHANRNTDNRSSHPTLRTPSPRTQRFRGLRDSGVPPPIPPQFRAPNFDALPALAIPNNSPNWPLTQSQASWDRTQPQNVPMGYPTQRSPARHRAHESPISPRHGQPTRHYIPTYRGVRI